MYTQHQPHVSALPPWERRELEQVPYQARSTSSHLGSNQGSGGPLFDDSVHQLPSNRDRGQCSYPPQSYSSHRQPAQQHNSAFQSRTPASATLPGHSQGQRATSYDNGPGSAPAQHPTFQRVTDAQAFATPREPPTPPYSNHSSATSSPPLDQSHFHRAQPVSLPGTMSTRERQSSRSQSNGPPKPGRDHQRKTSVKSDKSDGPRLGTRLKSTFKDLFKRDPIDETEFERIDRRHWADDE